MRKVGEVETGPPATGNGQWPEVFISYCHEDQAFLAEFLRFLGRYAKNFSVFIDEKDRGGETIDEAIGRLGSGHVRRLVGQGGFHRVGVHP